MEFRFNLNELFHDPCVEIGNTLIPPGFSGDKRALWDTQSKVTQIVNAIGEASAHAQGLSKPITTADRLRNSEHRLYLLIDQTANHGKGAVTGMLKTGEKGLYVFDREGQHYQVSPPCVLDFYIHDSRQRTGLGRKLFEHMLEREQLEPNKMAIDRPSDKLLGFLNKHYGLNTPVKQMNNYVVFDGFFPKLAATPKKIPTDKSNSPTKKQSANGLQQSHHASPYGRYAAAHPACSMGEIIHNDSPIINRNQEPTGVKSEPLVTHGQGGIDYHPNAYSNQLAWQTTQSVPNMPVAHNQYPYSQNNSMSQNPNYYYMAQGDAMAQNGPQTYYYPPQNQQIPSPQVVQPQPTRTKEPLIPQSFDGTPKKIPHAVQSMPAQGDRRQIPAPFALQSSISAPNNYQRQMMNNYPQNANFVPQQNNNYQPATVASLPTMQQNVAPVVNQVPQQIQNEVSNQMMQNTSGVSHPGIPQQNYNDGASQINPMTYQSQTNQGVSQLNPVVNQVNPGIPQQSYNDGTNQMTYQNQANQGVSQTNPTCNQVNRGISQQNYTDSTNQMNFMTHQNQEVPQINPMMINQNQMTPMINQNQANPGASQMNLANNQNQMNPTVTNQNQMNPISNQTEIANQMDQNQVTNQMHQNQVTNQMQSSVVVNQNDTMVNQHETPQNRQQIMPNPPVPTQQQKMYNQGNYPQMVDQFENMALQPNVNNQKVLVSNDQPTQAIQMTNWQNSQQQNLPQNVANNQSVHEDSRVPFYQNEVDISKGYPPQQPHNHPSASHQSTANGRTPTKADRPNSLNIEINDDEELFKLKQEPEGRHEHEDHLGHGESDSLYGDAVDSIDEEMRKVEIAPEGNSPLSTGSKSPGIEAAGYVTPGRNTPGMKTDQGYYDLKFFHNKLW